MQHDLDRFRIWQQTDDHVQLSAHGLYVIYAEGPAPARVVDQFINDFNEFARAERGPIGLMLSVTSSSRPPEDVQRDRMNAALATHLDKLAGVAICVPTSGFASVALRAVVTGVFLLKNTGYPAKVSGDAEQALQWLASRMEVPAERLSRVHASAVQHLDSRSRRNGVAD